MKPSRQNISPQAKELIKRIYAISAVGCCWHLVLDDDNWDSIVFSREWARDNAAADSEFPCTTKGACQELAALEVTASILRRARTAAFEEMRNEKKYGKSTKPKWSAARIPMKQRRLPDMRTVAATMDEIFVPDECKADEILIRRGRISRDGDEHECVMAAIRRSPRVHALLVLLVDGEWSANTNIGNEDFELLRKAIEELLATSIITPFEVAK